MNKKIIILLIILLLQASMVAAGSGSFEIRRFYNPNIVLEYHYKEFDENKIKPTKQKKWLNCSTCPKNGSFPKIETTSIFLKTESGNYEIPHSLIRLLLDPNFNTLNLTYDEYRRINITFSGGGSSNSYRAKILVFPKKGYSNEYIEARVILNFGPQYPEDIRSWKIIKK